MSGVLAPPRGTSVAGVAELEAAARNVREHIVDMCAGQEGGHLGGSMSLVEILVALYFDVMRIDPARPRDPDRDTLLLSKGHGGIGLYAALAERGFFPAAQLAGYGGSGSEFMAHPHPEVPGVEMPTGSLGHGLALGVGSALADRLDRSDRRTFVIMGDGELQEGSVWEAAMAASGHGLDNLTAVIDRNGLQITGRTETVVGLEPLAERWRAFGWSTTEVDGHDLGALTSALREPPEPGRPTMVIARTVKGKGLPFIEGQARSHYARLGERQHRRALAVLRACGTEGGK
ncbi:MULTISPECIES: transketolase [Streptomyces]|uniref:transketolase n=1 Tax=Streptomyces TaxID=1883 RepID=UPI0004ABB3A9|nr:MULTISPECIES: transketolase [Streptomyces]